MEMRHSVEEWWISAATELDRLHGYPAAAAGAAGPKEPLPNDGPGPNLSMMGRVTESCSHVLISPRSSEASLCL